MLARTGDVILEIGKCLDSNSNGRTVGVGHWVKHWVKEQRRKSPQNKESGCDLGLPYLVGGLNPSQKY